MSITIKKETYSHQSKWPKDITWAKVLNSFAMIISGQLVNGNWDHRCIYFIESHGEFECRESIEENVSTSREQIRNGYKEQGAEWK